MKIRTAYGIVISRARKDKGLTLRQVSERAIVSFSYLYEVEKGKKEASSEYLGSILKALELSPVEFFNQVAAEYQRLTEERLARAA